VREETSGREVTQESEPGFAVEPFAMQAVAMELCEIPLPSATPQELLADLFHALNQPLAALRCSCELALLAPRTAEQYRDCLQTALQKTEQASLLSKGIREFLEAGEEAEEEKREKVRALPQLSLREQVREAAEHFLPVAAEAGTTFCADYDGDSPADDSLVDFHPEHLRRALFYIFDCTLALARGKKVRIDVESNSSQVTLHLSFSTANADGASFTTQTTLVEQSHSQRERNQQDQWQPKLQWAIAQQLFRAYQGSLAMTSRNDELCVEARLPLAGPGSLVSPPR
jgi:signal transduction histidine kinase